MPNVRHSDMREGEKFNMLYYMLHMYVFLCACLHVCAYTDTSSQQSAKIVISPLLLDVYSWSRCSSKLN